MPRIECVDILMVDLPPASGLTDAIQAFELVELGDGLFTTSTIQSIGSIAF